MFFIIFYTGSKFVPDCYSYANSSSEAGLKAFIFNDSTIKIFLSELFLYNDNFENYKTEFIVHFI